MKMTSLRKRLSFILCMMLIAAMALFTTGCGDNNQETGTVQEETTQEETAQEGAVREQNEESAKVQSVGEGDTQFSFTVVNQEGNETAFLVHTDKEIVGEALVDCGLITGEDGEFGLYVKEVNGITADYNKDGAYWSFYVNGEYAQSGVDTTSIEEGVTYTFKYEKQ